MLLFPVAVSFRDQKPTIVPWTAVILVADLKHTGITFDAEGM